MQTSRAGEDEPGLELFVDSSAAIAMMTREGLGKARHIDTQVLWVQEAVQNNILTLKKVRTDLNPADIFTKQLPERNVNEHLWSMGCFAQHLGDDIYEARRAA